MVKCGNCGCEGHNKRTCTLLKGPVDVSLNKLKTTKISKKKTIESIALPTREEALVKLKEIELTRPEQYHTANECADSLMKGKNIMITAEEKTGKRCILEAIHLIMIINHYLNVPDETKEVPRSIYITALNRKDTKVQFKEQEEEYGIRSVSTKMDNLRGDIINILNRTEYDGMIYIHIDECDYGTGEEQALSKLYNSKELQIPENKKRIQFIAYSATPEELEYSELNEDEWLKVIFRPSEAYFGAEKYLERDLVRIPEVFYDGEGFTDHGVDIINDVKVKCADENIDVTVKQRNVIVVRDTTSGFIGTIKHNRVILGEKYGCEIYVYDQSTGFQWGSPESWCALGHKEIKDDNMMVIGHIFKPVVIFISQTCTRSTEICPLGHRKIHAWHDARKLGEHKAYNTLSQAVGRVKHYTQSGHPENTIYLYCDEDILNFTVGRELNTKTLKLGQRIHTNASKMCKWKFEDEYKYPNDVPEDKWLTKTPKVDGEGLPEGIRKEYKFSKETIKGSSGKWVHFSCNNSSHNQWGKLAGGVSTRVPKRYTINYESETSNRFLIRKAIIVLEETDNSVNFTHTTKSSSMYVASVEE